MTKGAKGFADTFNMQAAKTEFAAIREKQERRGLKHNFWKPPKGKSIFRVLPSGSEYLTSRGKIGKMVYKYFLYWDGKGQGIHICGRMTDEERFKICPIEEALEQVSSILPDDVYKRQRPKGRGFFNILLKKVIGPAGEELDRDLWGTTVICDGPVKLYDFVQTSIIDPDVGLFVDPNNGADVILTRTGDKLSTEYDPIIKPGPWGPVLETEEETAAFIEKLPDLDRMTMLTKDQVNKQLEVARDILRMAAQYGEVSQDLAVASGSIDTLIAAAADPAGGSNVKTTASTAVKEPMKRATPAPTPPAAAPTPDGQPELNAEGVPVCFGQLKARNPEGLDNVTDPQCKPCQFQLACGMEA